MAEKSTRRREDRSRDDRRRDGDGHADSQRSMDAGDVARRAMGQVMELTGRDADVVTSIERTDDGWRVGVEIIEIRRVPDTADILATYEVELDGDGRLVGYRRVGRYSRSQVDREGP